MKKTPRPYQVDIVNRTSKSLSVNKAVICHAPTGAGKSVIIDDIVSRATSKGKTVLVLSDARKIFNQLLTECNGVEISSRVKSLYIQKGTCYVGMIQTLLKRPVITAQLNNLGTNLILLIDECHISTSTKLIDLLPEANRIGFTATPYGKIHPHLPKYYNDLVEGPQVDWLIQNGYLTNYRHIVRTSAEINQLEIRNGEYTERSQDRVFTSKGVYDGLFEDLSKFTFKKCVIFVASIKQADALNTKLQARGFSSCAYHSQAQHGEYELGKFTDLDLCNILVTIKSLSKGWDFPPIDLVVLMHKTLSTSLYQQEVGRGSRLFPGKDIFTVLDYGDNLHMHGFYFEDRPYSDLWKLEKKKSNKITQSITKECPECFDLLPASVRKCRYCGYEFPEVEVKLKQGELVDMTESYNRLIGKKVSELTPEELAAYAKIKNKKQYAIRVAKALEQKLPGYIFQFAYSMGYKNSWLDGQHIPAEPIHFNDLVLR